MPSAAIPAWNAQGLIPPVDVIDPVSADRSPYVVTLTDLILRFDTSTDRRNILRGFLDYRAALHAAGLTIGFQWINGSFVEDIENSARNRPPGDVDVVTFYQLPAGVTQRDILSRAPELFDHALVKATYHVDEYTCQLNTSGERLVNRSAYWYSIWAHQRDTFLWKGFLQVHLAPGQDTLALQLFTVPGGAP
jgi:hypothetical protein